MAAFDVLLEDERTQFDAFVDDLRNTLARSLDGMGDDEVRRRLVPSETARS